MLKQFTIIFCILLQCLALSGNGFCQTSAQEKTILDLIDQAHRKKLHQSRYWQVLLHYKTNIFGILESEVDSPAFFNSKDGKFDSEKELTQTIRSFFKSDDEVITGYPHPQCRFVSRFKWLSRKLETNFDQAPRRLCSEYLKWKTMLAPESVTMVFPSYDLFAPGSMFGHTLLRVNSQGNNKTSILNFSINFAADVDEEKESEISYAVKGIFGGFKGYFNVVPYWKKVREYSDIDFRDIWEFDLPLNQEEIDRMLDHTWELRFVHFDYYFFKENCSYHLLSLLEAARPEWDLQSNYLFWVTPTETIRDVLKQIKKPATPVYRPSRYSKYQKKRDTLKEDDFEIYKNILKTPQYMERAEFQNLTLNRKTLILDLLIDYYGLQKNGKLLQKQKIKVLKKRASLRLASPSMNYKSVSSSPDKGHGTFKTGVAYGVNSDDLSFNEVLFRMSFHDLLDSETGFSPYSQLEFGRLVLRKEKKSVYIKEFFIVDVYSLLGVDEALNSKSWRMAAGWFQDMALERDNRGVFTVQGGIGQSYEFLNFRYYQLLETHLNASEAYRDAYQLGAGLNAGIISKWNDYLKTEIKISCLNFLFGENDIYMKYTIRTRFKINDQNELRFKYHYVKNGYESALGWNIFF